MDAIRTVGLAGVGRMGLPVAHRLMAAGFRLTVFDLDPQAMAAAAAAGAVAAASCQALGQCDLSITLLPTVAATESALFGTDGILEKAIPGHIHILMGTFGPDFVRQAVSRAEGLPVVLVDCPVSGSVDHARDGRLTAIVGSDEATFDRIGAVLAALCGKIIRVGPAGDAAGVKLAVNAVVGNLNHALAEALLLAEGMGLDLEKTYDVFEASVVACPYVGYKRKNIFAHLRPADGTIRQITKDLDLALDLSARHGLGLPHTRIARDSLARAGDWGDPEDDLGRVFAYLRAGRTQSA